MTIILKQKIIESSKTILFNELEEKKFRTLFKVIDYRRPNNVKNFSKTLSIFEKEILFKNFLFKMETLVSCLEEQKKFSYNQLIIRNILGDLNNSIISHLNINTSLEHKVIEERVIQSNFTPFFYKNTLRVRGGDFNGIISKSLNKFIFSLHFFINDNLKINWDKFQKVYKYKKVLKYTFICCMIFLIFYLNKNKIQQLLFLCKSKLKFIKILSERKKKLLFQNLKKTSKNHISQKVKLLKKFKFKPFEIVTGQKEKLEGKKSLKSIYEKIPKQEIKTFFKKLSNTIDGALKVKIKFKPFKKNGSNEELDFNSTINKLFDLLSEDI